MKLFNSQIVCKHYFCPQSDTCITYPARIKENKKVVTRFVFYCVNFYRHRTFQCRQHIKVFAHEFFLPCFKIIHDTINWAKKHPDYLIETQRRVRKQDQILFREFYFVSVLNISFELSHFQNVINMQMLCLGCLWFVAQQIQSFNAVFFCNPLWRQK